MDKRFGGQSGRLMAGLAAAGAAAQALQALANARRGEKVVTDIAHAGISMLQSVTDHLQARYRIETQEQPQAAPAKAAPEGFSRADALARLGLRNDASDEEIRAAHRRLIQQVHPDRGGSDWLAQQLNEARDVLLAGRG